MALKLGAEDKKKVAIVIGLGVVLVGLAAYQLYGFFNAPDNPAVVQQQAVPPTVSPSMPAAGQPQATAARPIAAGNALGLDLDPSLHPEWMAAAENLVYTGKGRNIFSLTSEPVIEKPKAPARPSAAELAKAAEAAKPAGPPPPPPIELKFFGYTATRKGLRKAYLLHNDDVFVAAEGDVVDRRYKVGKITATTVQVTDLPFSNTQTLHLQSN